ncbi:MAG: hypothetical protein COB58_03015 [Thalassobium sp.]|nr:MAG: hypothetical protein COB58_12735 [Thalassobium sp.]PHQ87775.1 MAG: hypothetical protein COB58_03015 [Thalassobium sp.]
MIFCIFAYIAQINRTTKERFKVRRPNFERQLSALTGKGEVMLGFIRGEELELHTLSTHMVYVQTLCAQQSNAKQAVILR